MSDLARLIQASAHHLPMIDDKSVQCVVTSPPYFGLRKYDGVQDVEWSEVSYSPMAGLPPLTVPAMTCPLGNEPTIEAFIGHLILCAREWRRVLADDGVMWVNLGDSFSGSSMTGGTKSKEGGHDRVSRMFSKEKQSVALPPKNLMMIPARFALAMQADGWILRSEVIWCLSGGTVVYARTQKGDYPMTIKDLSRLDPATVKLWNGEKWTQLLGMSKTKRNSDELELVLRSGERISCTPTHKFPTQRGLLTAAELTVGDTLQRCRLPAPDRQLKPAHITEEAAWFAGLYVAEGSRSGDTIQISGHAKEELRWVRLQKIAEAYGGTATRTIIGNKMDIRLYGKMLNAIINYLVTGSDSKTKAFAPVVWQYDYRFLDHLLGGYLAGDGHWDEKNNRWRLGFTRNYNLERDLRTLCARLGYTLTLNLSRVAYDGGFKPTFRGEIRTERSGHFNERDTAEIVEIRKARCREVYDLGVEDEPHLFALASGILTHNSKPNPMPESVTDRPTKAHEQIYLFSKQERYFYDHEAVREPLTETTLQREKYGRPRNGHKAFSAGIYHSDEQMPSHFQSQDSNPNGRNLRTVWSVATQPYSAAHFACFPPALVEPMIKAGSRVGDTVLDPFGGSQTTGKVAIKLGRRYIGVDLSEKYLDELAPERLTVQMELTA